jgi:ketosteroid isomerase-like protein
MGFDIDGLLELWSGEAVHRRDAEEAFRAFYTDPVTVNGAALAVADLVARGVALQATFEQMSREVLDVCQTGDKVAVAFRMWGTQTGPLATSAGVLEPTGRPVSIRVIDILTLSDDGRITSLWMVADELGALAAVDAVTVGTAGA